MAYITVFRKIDAPPETTFQTVAHIDKFSQALPHVVDYEFLTDQTSGVGTRFRETRGRLPRALDELVQAGLIRQLPRTANDEPYVYEPATGAVTDPLANTSRADR